MHPALSAKERSSRLYSPQEIQSIYNACATKLDLFDRLLNDENSQGQSHSMMDEIEEASKINQGPKRGHKQHGCKCSKIGCLKLYCECFSNGRQCTSACECSCCHNREGYEKQILEAKMMANYRHPGQFKGVPAWTPVRKCTCKKSMCRKKYCECFNAGLECTEFCECKDCHNGQPHRHDQSYSTKQEIMMDIQVHA